MLLGRHRRGIDVLAVVSVFFVSAGICYGLCSQDINPSLTNWTAPGNDAAFICCGGTWDSHDIEWQKRVDVKGTRWCGQWRKLGRLIKENAVYGVQTLAIMYRHSGCPQYCIDMVPKHYWFWYAPRWLVFGHLHACPNIATFFTSHNSSLSGCVVSTRFKKSGMAFTFLRANRSEELEDQVTDQYLRYDPGHNSLRSLKAFSGRTIYLACTHEPSISATFISCESYMTETIEDALTIVNATLVKVIFSGDDLRLLYLHENIDVIMSHYIVDNALLIDYDVPLVSDILASTFYLRKPSTEPVTVAYILEGSKLSLYFLVVSLLLCFAVLLVTDLLDATTSGITVASDIMLFFVATFLATSCDLPAAVRHRATRLCLVLAWVVGIFSFSVYFRAQLTSWLISEIPEGIVDDLIKLEAALDGNTILPCVTRDHRPHIEIDRADTTGLLGKLKISLGPQTTETVKETLDDCLRCASKTARICIAVRMRPCMMKILQNVLAESKEPLWFEYGALPVRKHYPLRMAFRLLAERVFEADWLHRTYLDCKVSGERLVIPPTPESLNLSAVARIMLTCFGVSLAVFILEVLLGRS